MKIVQICPMCGGPDWTRVDDQFKCAACGCVCYTEEMSSAVLEENEESCDGTEEDKPKCPYCGNTMTLVTLSLQYPPDIQHQYQCLRCQAAAPKGTTDEDAYRLAKQRSCEGR